MKKNSFIAVFLAATLPGLGHLYMGQPKRSLLIFTITISSLILEIFVIYPTLALIISPLFSENSFISQLLLGLINLFLWVYLLQIKDTYTISEKNKYSERKIKVRIN